MRTKIIRLAAALGALALAPAAAQAAAGTSPDAPKRSCFASNTWDGWNVAETGDALYLKVGLNDVYRVELTPGSKVRKYPGNFLVNQVRGSSWICSALDLDLSISDNNGFKQPLIAQSMRRLSKAEADAIPKKFRP